MLRSVLACWVMKLSIVGILCSLSLSAHALADNAVKRPINIPGQNLATALEQLSRQSGTDLVYRPEQVRQYHSHELIGQFTAREAVTRLLQGTPLTVSEDPTGALLIAAPLSLSNVAAPAGGALAPAQSAALIAERRQLAQAAAGGAPQPTGVRIDSTSSESPQSPIHVEEVVVTAQKRTERLQDVPVPVSVVRADTLAENNQPLLRDYFSTVPGLNVSPGAGQGSQQMLTIRGISSGPFLNPTVGVTVDDVPFNAFTRELTPDFDPSDLERVEVLRGPQGTLYGASSMGGLMKFVTVNPSMDHVFGHVDAGVSSVENGAQAGYSFRGAVNVPISDVFAFRLSGFTRQDPGYIDNPVLGIRGLNKAHVSGGHISALWQLSDTFSLKLSALYQYTKSDGLSDVNSVSNDGKFQQNYIAYVGPSNQTVQAYSAILSGKAGSADVTAITGYSGYRAFQAIDYSSLQSAKAVKNFGVSGVALTTNYNTQKFSQEIRTNIPFGHTFEWLIGGFFTHEDIPAYTTYPVSDPSTGVVVGSLGTLSIPIQYTEYAAFTDLTVHFTDRFDLQIGGRESHLEENFDTNTESGILYGGGTILVPAIKATPNVFTYLVTPSFKVSADLLAYARLASGYRPGRANQFNPDPLVPRAAGPDETKNYEIGIKGDLFERELSFDASVYYIDFKSIQSSLLDSRNGFAYYTNGNGAKSEGAELSLTAKPIRGLTLSAWGSYDNAVLTDSFPAGSTAYAPAGSRLPFGARWSGSFSADQEFPLVGNITGFGGATLSYVGERVGAFTSSPARAVYPGYSKVDLRAGMNLDSWKLSLYANNVGNKRALLGGGPGNFPANAYLYLVPRTVGLNVSKSFKGL